MCGTEKNSDEIIDLLNHQRVQHQVKYLQIFRDSMLLSYSACICLIRQFSRQEHCCVYQKLVGDLLVV
jgi:hypothetical protein